ncbi:rhodanese domain-containing protein CG4456-like isoform X2 [Condylostylus longicornis]|uniref:rhodanese domain-containing protein CG4456-like isoform X2 n=1 Tax=Condylostylus longicornis TaxID=2530218 RepID=UPI00244DA276|nr:rhodanese domain-containing protein CG4456-like isoform X2 [Condylostylus longicornis]
MSFLSLALRRLKFPRKALASIATTSIIPKYKVCSQFQIFLPVTGPQVKSYCSEPNPPEIVIAYYDEIKSLPDHPEKLLIDVREPEELKETGKIPTSINIPLKNVSVTLGSQTSEEDFKRTFSRSKPHYESIIIFSCKSGKRALKAYQNAEALGYKNSKLYAGSWLDWAKHEGLPE